MYDSMGKEILQVAILAYVRFSLLIDTAGCTALLWLRKTGNVCWFLPLVTVSMQVSPPISTISKSPIRGSSVENKIKRSMLNEPRQS
jgi:hypothetical protein